MIYFCLPALNEERTVGVVLWKLRQVMTELQRDFQIIVVDDASTDATQEVLNPYARVLPLTLIRNEKQLGYAASLEIAIREAVRRSPYPKRDAIVTLQADFTEDPDCVSALVKRVEAGADLVVCAPQMDDATPKRMQRARRLFRWLVRKYEWHELGDPFSGLRAYRVMAIKRALEARGTARLLSWEGIAANAELLAQTVPHSRRNDIIESTLHYRRLQRPSRFRFLAALSQVMGVRSGKPANVAPVTVPDTTVVVPTALAVEMANGHRREAARRRTGGTRHDEQRRPRGGRGGRDGSTPRRERPPQRGDESRPPRAAGEKARGPRKPRAEAVNVEPVVTSDAAAQPEAEKRKRRPRRRSRKRTQRAENAGTNGAGESPEAVVGATDAAAPEMQRKKSRRGRRGGRGRKRTPRADAGEQQSSSMPAPDSASEAPQS